MPSRARSSDGGGGSLIVIEGMPGAGKTSAVSVLEQRGHRVVGEYISECPAIDEDEAHQRNWLVKTAATTRAMTSGDVFCDRDFLTSIAFACSIADRELMTQRTAWALAHLAAGRLVIGDAYLVLDLSPRLSLARRANRLRSEHPWSWPQELERLRRFYLSPLEALGRLDADLEVAFADSRWCHISGEATSPDHVAVLAEGLAEEVERWPP